MVTLALAIGACRSERPATIYDLARSLPIADVGRERRALDLGTSGARDSLLAGWSWNERTEAGTPFVWSHGRRSVLELELHRLPVDAVELRGSPWAPPDGVAQAVSVGWNGRLVGEIEMAPEMASYRLPLPADVVLPGINRVTFAYRSVRSDHHPGQVARGRDLGVAWESVAVLPGGLAGPVVGSPGVERVGDAIVLEAGARLAYPLDLPVGSRLAFDRLVAEPAGGAVLVVWLGPVGGPLEEVARVGAGDAAAIPLSVTTGGWSELWLIALGSHPTRPARLRLVRPGIVAAGSLPAPSG